MSARGVVQVVPDDLVTAAAAFRSTRHLADDGATWNVHVIAQELGASEASVASSDFSRRLLVALEVLDGRRGCLRRGLASAASAYGTSGAQVAREMRPGS